MDFINEKWIYLYFFAFFSCFIVTKLDLEIMKNLNPLVTWYGRKISRWDPSSLIKHTCFPTMIKMLLVYLNKDHFVPFLILFQLEGTQKCWHDLFIFSLLPLHAFMWQVYIIGHRIRFQGNEKVNYIQFQWPLRLLRIKVKS